MPSFLLRPKVTLFAAALVVPVLANGACNKRTACLAYSQAEYAANNNSCLSQSDALATFSSPSCPGSIASVDGPGSFDGEICCYPVTYAPIDQSCNQTTDTGLGGSTPFPGTTVVTTTTLGCPDLCAVAISLGQPPCENPTAVAAWDALLSCAGCSGPPPGVDCSGECSSLCTPTPLESTCGGCLMNSCANELANCQAN